MIYFQTIDKRYVLILEPSQLEGLKGGTPAVSDDKKVLVAYSPDIEWTFAELQRLLGPTGRAILPQELDKILKDSLLRQTVMRPATARVQRGRPFNPTMKGKK